MTEYTKGPWVAKKSPFEVVNRDHGCLINEVCSGNVLIAALYGDSIDANATLISAAPDMLEALEALVAAVEREAKIEGVSGIACEKLPFARAAIAKAKGQ